MFRKASFLLVLILFSACHTTQTVVRTTKKMPPKTTRTASRTTKKTNHNKQVTSAQAPKSSQQTPTRKSEVIESTSKTVVYTEVVNGYVSQFKDIAMGNMKTYGIPASIILAQGILESGAGKGDLALSANNHFGIKCHNDWTGETVRHDDDSDQECFRKYKDPSESYRDHALFLTTRTRYSALFKLPKGDYEAWARGLRAAGYATDPKYPEKLIGYIERYNLHQYDSQVLGTEYVPFEGQPVAVSNSGANAGTYEVQKGDTLYSISKKFNITVDQLRQKNNLADNSLSIGQKLIVQ
ncbi:MAG: hemagglutinin [Flavobacterium sp. BFFFF1]|uniref:glucosaminidase domain-containing protein n=1 Tax=Flavobacterium sp. BFFFF1 TaxID=2015557 RepID=UPI000BD3C36B|nr:glucosaminidase domain-containing protein [Flavobacterium sp. BFFFF1]OYU81630.1 MAG: hemagglutinin [Flavobacterium sp. BFFFF1]